MAEINVYGIYFPMLLVQAILAYLLFKLLGKWLDRFAQSGWVSLPGVFNLCVYLGLLLLVHWAFTWF